MERNIKENLHLVTPDNFSYSKEEPPHESKNNVTARNLFSTNMSASYEFGGLCCCRHQHSAPVLQTVIVMHLCVSLVSVGGKGWMNEALLMESQTFAGKSVTVMDMLDSDRHYSY